MEITNFYSNENVQDCPINKHPEYAFIGRSNVGKSSLINLLANKKNARISSKPGKTKLIHHIIIGINIIVNIINNIISFIVNINLTNIYIKLYKYSFFFI